MSNWRNYEAGRTGLSVAGLADGESIQCVVADSPFRRDTDESADALHVPCRVGDVPDHLTDMSGDELDSETDYNIINSSAGFFEALLNAFPEDQQVAGNEIVITAHQPDDNFSRYYDIEAVE